jgi:hypothetical protein
MLHAPSWKLFISSKCKWVDIEVAVLIAQKDALVACSTIQSLVTLTVDLFSNQCYNKIQGQLNVPLGSLLSSEE